MKKCALLGITIMLALTSFTQDTSQATIRHYKEFHQAVSFNINGPVGAFDETHFIGLGLRYSWSPQTGNKNTDKSKSVRLITEGSFDYFFGKRDSYNYKNKGYGILQALIGILFQPGIKSYYCLSSGAAIDRYGGHSDLGLGISLNGNFYAKENLAITTGLRLIKFREAEGLWIVSVGVNYIF